jgi:hypothetical protein
MSEAESLPWLLDKANPSARYLALTQLLDQPKGAPEVVAAQAAIPSWGPARDVLDAQWPKGYWMQPGIGYSPKYKATVWQVIFWAALGGPLIPEIRRACRYVLIHGRLLDGRFSAYKTPLGAIPCLGGNLVRAMLQMGLEDSRVLQSLEALASQVTRHGFRCRFNVQSAGQSPPKRMDGGLPCAWGAIKVLAACAQVEPELRSSNVAAATARGIEFLKGGDLARGDFPTATGVSPLWQKLGYPLGYTSDILEGAEALIQLREGGQDWLSPTMDLIRAKGDREARWLLEYTPKNKWASFGRVGQPNKWVTLRALTALGLYDRSNQLASEHV